MIDMNKAHAVVENFSESEAWEIGYHKGLLTMTDIFAEAIYDKKATIQTLKKMLAFIRLNTIPLQEPIVATQMPDGTEI